MRFFRSWGGLNIGASLRISSRQTMPTDKEAFVATTFIGAKASGFNRKEITTLFNEGSDGERISLMDEFDRCVCSSIEDTTATNNPWQETSWLNQ